jgi:arylsulfatase A-like enzyme
MQGISRSIDIAPTILEVAGLKQLPMDGASSLPFVEKGIFPSRPRYAENRWACVSLVREDGIKFLSTGPIDDTVTADNNAPAHHRLAVFDLAQDPNEYNNLIETSIGDDALRWAIETHHRLKVENVGETVDQTH